MISLQLRDLWTILTEFGKCKYKEDTPDKKCRPRQTPTISIWLCVWCVCVSWWKQTGSISTKQPSLQIVSTYCTPFDPLSLLSAILFTDKDRKIEYTQISKFGAGEDIVWIATECCLEFLIATESTDWKQIVFLINDGWGQMECLCT